MREMGAIIAVIEIFHEVPKISRTVVEFNRIPIMKIINPPTIAKAFFLTGPIPLIPT